MDNKRAAYRQIRYDRTYRPLGKMSWWRVILGLTLLVFVFLLSGTVSQGFASRGHFKTARTLMVSPAWVEKYKPELKAFIDAGIPYENGDYEAALQAFDSLDNNDAAVTMHNRCAVKLASEKITAGEYDDAFRALAGADASILPDAEAEEFYSDCTVLLDHYSKEAETGDAARNESAIRLLTSLLEEKERST